MNLYDTIMHVIGMGHKISFYDEVQILKIQFIFVNSTAFTVKVLGVNNIEYANREDAIIDVIISVIKKYDQNQKAQQN